MTNHVHLLLALETIAGLGQLMKRLVGRQTCFHGVLRGRSGTLWESHYKSSPVDTDGYLLACDRYIALGASETQRRVRYQEYVRAAIPEGEWSLIRDAVQRGQLMGRRAFINEVEAILGRRIEQRSRGRPKGTRKKVDAAACSQIGGRCPAVF